MTPGVSIPCDLKSFMILWGPHRSAWSDRGARREGGERRDLREEAIVDLSLVCKGELDPVQVGQGVPDVEGRLVCVHGGGSPEGVPQLRREAGFCRRGKLGGATPPGLVALLCSSCLCCELSAAVARHERETRAGKLSSPKLTRVDAEREQLSSPRSCPSPYTLASVLFRRLTTVHSSKMAQQFSTRKSRPFPALPLVVDLHPPPSHAISTPSPRSLSSSHHAP